MLITTSPLVKTYTLQEFWDLPEPADGSKQLIKGVLYMTPPPGHSHNQNAADLHEQLGNALRQCGYRGQIFFPRSAIWVDEDTYLEPDLMYISDELKAQMDPEHWTRATSSLKSCLLRQPSTIEPLNPIRIGLWVCEKCGF